MRNVISAIVISCAMLAGAVSSAFASYGVGFEWVRQTDWTPGTIGNSTTGNPDDDSLGNPTWFYERSQGGNLASSNPWYAQPRNLQIWSNDTQQWRAGTSDQDPAMEPSLMEQTDVNFTFASPVVLWQNPTGSSLTVNIGVGTNVRSNRIDSNSEEIELAIVEVSSGSVFNVLWSSTETAPDNGVIQIGSPVVLSNVSLSAGDGILFTSRIKQDSPMSGNGSVDWFDAASITIVPEPATFSLLLLAGVPLLNRQRKS